MVPIVFATVLIHFSTVKPLLYFYFTILLTALSLIPYFFLIMKFAERFYVDDEKIIQKNRLMSLTLKWKDIIEYRDFYNVIVLMPLNAIESMNLYFYRNIAGFQELRSYLKNRSHAYEVNMMARKRDRVFLLVDLGLLPVLGIVVLNIAMAVLITHSSRFDLKGMLAGTVSGVWFVLYSVMIWVLLHDFTQPAKQHRHIMATLMAISIVVPLIAITGPIWEKDNTHVGAFLVTYILGYAMGWGGMSAFFPNRELRNERRRSRQ